MALLNCGELSPSLCPDISVFPKSPKNGDSFVFNNMAFKFSGNMWSFDGYNYSTGGNTTQSTPTDQKSWLQKNWKWVLLLIGLLIAAYYAWQKWFKK